MSFTSLISPGNIKNLRLINTNFSKTKNKKLFLKQSYMLLTWLHYISTYKKNLFTLPKKVKKFTLTKSPMAHKTFSQEQFKFVYYSLIIPYKISINNFRIKNIIKVLQFILNYREYSTKNYVGTNLMFLKKKSFSIKFSEEKYFKL